MLYLKLRQVLMNERAAIAAMSTFAGFNGIISPRRERNSEGVPGGTLTRFVVMVPAGRRPDAVRKQLATQAPHTEWILVDVDADGFETACTPEDSDGEWLRS